MNEGTQKTLCKLTLYINKDKLSIEAIKLAHRETDKHKNRAGKQISSQ